MTLTFTVQTNATLTVSSSAPLFAGVVAGDGVFIPHTTTGDLANVINVLNAGYWTVLSVADTQNVTLVRQAGQVFEGTSESVAIISNSQFVAFSSTGIQAGDSMVVSAGFSPAVNGTYSVVNVTDSFVEVVSSSPLPNQVGVTPGVSGMVFYDELRRMIYIESSQEIVVRVNGDTGNFQRVAPVDASDPTKPGVWFKWGPTWSLSLVNIGSTVANVTVIHCE
jgi:hypothetical protein